LDSPLDGELRGGVRVRNSNVNTPLAPLKGGIDLLDSTALPQDAPRLRPARTISGLTRGRRERGGVGANLLKAFA
jgi:hypothetical protein